MNLSIQDFAAILIPMGGMFWLLWNRISKIEDKLEKAAEERREIKQEILWIKFQLGYNPDKQQEIHKEEPKEN